MMDNGLDNQGFIVNPTDKSLVQAEYQPLIDEVLFRLQKLLKHHIHSVYLYGSVARGEAIPGLSDLDINVVLNEPETIRLRYQLNQLGYQLTKDYPHLSKIDIEAVDLHDVLQEKQRYHWQFWLKHCCVCIWGENISLQFPRLKPSLSLACGLNQGFPSKIDYYLREISSENVVLKSKEVGKLFIRVAYALICEKDQSWFYSINKCAQSLKKHWPEYSISVQKALQFIEVENESVEEINKFVLNELTLLTKEFQAICKPLDIEQ